VNKPPDICRPTPTQQQTFDLSTPHTVNVSKVAVPNGRPNCLVFRLRDAVYAGPYAAWIPTMPPSQGVVLPNTPLNRFKCAACGGRADVAE
jgi:hypothetical protein